MAGRSARSPQGRALERGDGVRALGAALDDAEAPPAAIGSAASTQHDFRGGRAEIERVLLGRSDVRAVLEAEIADRERAAEEMQRLHRLNRAESLRQEALLARRYLD